MPERTWMDGATYLRTASVIHVRYGIDRSASPTGTHNEALVSVGLVRAHVDPRTTREAVDVNRRSVASQAFAKRRRSALQAIVTTTIAEVLNELRISADNTGLRCAARAGQVKVVTVGVDEVVSDAIADVFRGNRTLDAATVGIDDVVVDLNAAGRAPVVVSLLATTKVDAIAGVVEQRVVHHPDVMVIVPHVDALASRVHDVIHDIARRRVIDTLDVAASATDVMHFVTDDVVVLVRSAPALVDNDTATATAIAARRRRHVMDPAVAHRRIPAVHIDTDTHARATCAIQLEAVDIGVAAPGGPHRIGTAFRHQDRAMLGAGDKADTCRRGSADSGSDRLGVLTRCDIDRIARFGQVGSALDSTQRSTARGTGAGIVTRS